MPIRESQKGRYPKDWRQISEHIRVERAERRCECTGICGLHHGRCGATDGRPHPITGSLVVLTVMHLDHTPEHCDEDNLLAGCQRCHLAYDRDHHAETRARNQEKKLLAAGQGFLPFGDDELRVMAGTQKGDP